MSLLSTIRKPDFLWRFSIIILFILLFANILLIATGMLVAPRVDEWRIGDWLINYKGGFVRRGLIGEIALQVSRLFDFNVVYFIVSLQVLVYGVFYFNTLRLALKSSFSPVNFALLFSPAFMLFTLFDAQGTFRKEIILFALLSAVCAKLAFSKKAISSRLIVFIGAGSLVMILSHEMMVVYLPFFICVFLIYEKGFTTNTKKLIFALTPSVLAAIFIFLFGSGDHQNVTEICNSLRRYDIPYCNYYGAIGFLGKSLKTAHQLAVETANAEIRLIYPITAVLGLLPIALFVATKKAAIFGNLRGLTLWLALLISFSFIASLPLLWVVMDYGRMIYIPVVCLSLLTLFVMSRDTESGYKVTFKSIVPSAISLLFVTSWRLIHYLATIETSFPLFTEIKKLITRFL